MTQIQKPRAIVIGGSLAGLFAGNLLLRNGWDVDVYERVPQELAGRGAGIVTHPELLDALSRAGVVVDDSIGVKVETRVTYDRDGAVIGERRLPQILTAWGKIFQLLRDAFPDARYHSGAVAVSAENRGDQAVVTFSDGTERQADLVLATDGLRSAIREQLAPETQLEYAGYVAWRGLVDESALSSETRDALFGHFAFCLPPHEQMLGYPVAGKDNSTAPGERRYNFVWYRATSEQAELPNMLTDSTGKQWEGGIAPGLIRPDVLRKMEEAARTLLSPAFAEVVAKTAQPLFQPIYDLHVPRMDFGRIALMGDAAFVARPHCGMGVAKAAGDAVALIDALLANPDVPAAVRAYGAARKPVGDAIIEHARHLGAYMQAQLKSESDREMAERYRTPEAVMRETAVPPRT